MPNPDSQNFGLYKDMKYISIWCRQSQRNDKINHFARGNYYNLTGMLYGCWLQKIVTAYNLLLNI